CCLIYDLRIRLCRTSVLEPAGAFDVLVQCCRWWLVSDLVLHRNLLYQAQAWPRGHRNSSPRIPLDSLRRASWPAVDRLAHALRPFGACYARRRCCPRRRIDHFVTVNAEFSHNSIGLPILSKVSIPDSSKA